MSKRHGLVVVIVVAAMIFYFIQSFRRDQKKAQTENEYSEAIEDQVIDQKKQLVPEVQPEEFNFSGQAVSQTQSTNQTEQVSSELQQMALKNFNQQLAQLDKCLRLKPISPTPASSVTSESLLNHIQSTMGLPIVQLDDWSQFDVVDKNGTKKRIRVDYDYPDGATPNRRLSTYTMNRYGAYEVDNLTNDQSDNPNEAYIESLKEGQTLQQQEQSARIYFAQGEELIYTTKNGSLDTMSFSKGENSFICQNLTDSNSNCQCTQ